VLLEGDSKEAGTAKFYDLDDVRNKRKDLEIIVKNWVKVMDVTK
jgi:hypothetical protein